ncbi:MAG: hydrogenase maturation protease [Actinomycetota bacterium]|jgi:hydrogenase maturation protease|nr:hydrogenase maturation protease [Actinomycetota bacterium]MEA2532239.1 hydrogenase maturation protease [Actinomycetota bacterium]
MTQKMLVAGVGNIFFTDDAFGCEVVRRLANEDLPEGVTVADFGIKGVHLAYELLEGYDTVIIVDAAPCGGKPGDLYLIEPKLEEIAESPLVQAATEGESALIDAHGLEPDAIFGMLKALGGNVGRALVVGCEPEDVEDGLGLTATVEAAVEPAVRRLVDIIDRIQNSIHNGQEMELSVLAAKDTRKEGHA